MTADDTSTAVQTLLDERDVVAVAVRYCRAIDTKDWPALAEVFLPDAIAYLGDDVALTGLEAITGRIRRALSHLDDSQHLVGTHHVAVDGDTATHSCYLQAQHVRWRADGGPNYLVGGRYEDRLVRTPQGWRIAERRLVVMWTDGNPVAARPG
jgi:ketosteroid isomerase-like protein